LTSAPPLAKVRGCRSVPCRGYVTELQTRSAIGRSLIVEASFAIE
jgi:hypothetical protein